MPLSPFDTVRDGGAWAFWAVLLLPALALLLVSSVRRVGRTELLVVVRGGRVVRSAATGWLARLPGLERFVAVPTHRQRLPLVVRGRTCDGVEVLVLADLTLAVERVPHDTPYADPATAAVRVAEQVVAEALRDRATATLLDHLPDLEARLPAVITRRLAGGSVAAELTVTQVEAQLTPRLARNLRLDAASRS